MRHLWGTGKQCGVFAVHSGPVAQDYRQQDRQCCWFWRAVSEDVSLCISIHDVTEYAWSHSVHATNNDVIRDYVDYRHETGWEQWRTEGSRPVIYPNSGGPLPEPPDGRFRRVRDTREVLSIRVVVYPK